MIGEFLATYDLRLHCRTVLSAAISHPRASLRNPVSRANWQRRSNGTGGLRLAPRRAAVFAHYSRNWDAFFLIRWKKFVVIRFNTCCVGPESRCTEDVVDHWKSHRIRLFERQTSITRGNLRLRE